MSSDKDENGKKMSASAFFAQHYEGLMPQEAMSEGVMLTPVEARRLMIEYAKHVNKK